MRRASASLTKNVLHCGHHPHDLADLTAFFNALRLVTGRDLEQALAGPADPGHSAPRVRRKLLRSFAGPGRRLGDHRRFELVESAKYELRSSTSGILTA